MVWTKIIEMKRSKWNQLYLEGKMSNTFWSIRYEFEEEGGVQKKCTHTKKTLSKVLRKDSYNIFSETFGWEIGKTRESIWG